MRAQYLVWLLWILAFILAGWILSQLPLATLLPTLRSLSAAQWGLWFGINATVILVLTLRWKAFTDLLGLQLGFWQVLLIRQGGQAISFITPGPQFGGEPLQLYWMHQLSPATVPLRLSLLALVLDRFYELWINFSVLLVGVLILSVTFTQQGIGLHNIVLLLVLLVALLSLLGWLLLQQPAWLTQRIAKLARHWQQHPRLRQMDTHWQLAGTELKTLVSNSSGILLRAGVWSVLGWAGILIEVAVLLHFIQLSTSFSVYLLLMVVLRLALLLPLPGGIGTIEAAVLWAFQSVQLPASAALGFIALMRLRDAVILLAGLWCLRVMQNRTASKLEKINQNPFGKPTST